jgi:hypothetical protein
VIIDAIPDKVFGLLFDKLNQSSHYSCHKCRLKFILHVVEGSEEFPTLSHPLPPHFELLADAIDASHVSGHAVERFRSDGLRAWPLL